MNFINLLKLKINFGYVLLILDIYEHQEDYEDEKKNSRLIYMYSEILFFIYFLIK